MGRKSKRQIVKEKTEVKGVKIRCGACGKIVTAKTNEWDFHANSGECGMCGSHGRISVDLVCPKCGYKHYYVELNSW